MPQKTEPPSQGGAAPKWEAAAFHFNRDGGLGWAAAFSKQARRVYVSFSTTLVLEGEEVTAWVEAEVVPGYDALADRVRHFQDVDLPSEVYINRVRILRETSDIELPAHLFLELRQKALDKL
jgi:hypothetical protein